MIRLSNIKLPLGYSDDDIRAVCAKELRVPIKAIKQASLYRRSIDARHKNDIHYTTSIDVTLSGNEQAALNKAKCKNAAITEPYRYIPLTPKNKDKRPLIVGTGPAGLFCALTLAQSGIRPIVIERGSRVEERTKAVNRMWQKAVLDAECNVQFGEGGAGTFSDGKLNTGTKDGRSRKVLLEFAAHGAPDEILYNAKPHIGTDKLRDTVKNIREELIALGAEIYFDTKLTDIKTNDGAITAAEVEHHGTKRLIECNEIVLAIGHSARDTFELIHGMGIRIEPKSFSVGVRIEHLRENIDRSQYGAAHKRLPAAYYKQNVHLRDGRGVYTFCMCPGGVVVAAQSEENSVVTNGMSEFARDKVNSNAALLVSVHPDDIMGEHRLKGMHWQRELERKAFVAGGGDYRAPIIRVDDFLNKEISTRLGEVTPSYQPGTEFASMDDILPPFVTDSLREAIPLIDRRLHGFNHPDAILTAVESRSSSPIRITRDENMQSVSLKGLYPCGEGAGYAGGIVSAAVDGIKVAEKIITT
ncbi:NAD(P)/FAD-dependent oxidoreductase [Ruminococcus sp.]|uniref:NAD(P)/FAD-dependent oxidoreductase n=1 Tax=Ruminococcus sp. TaxID=41978 RepID=UPI0038694BF0